MKIVFKFISPWYFSNFSKNEQADIICIAIYIYLKISILSIFLVLPDEQIINGDDWGLPVNLYAHIHKIIRLMTSFLKN